jgi:methionyl-tRNA synthetase
MSTFITVSIPYVNATPHLGYAFELVEADLVARSHRILGEPIRFLGGTDDYSLKNVLAAEAAGLATQEFVDRHADQFQALGPLLDVSFDDFIRTSSDARHRPAVERLWSACERSGDLYQRQYEGLYCVGCEQFYEESELDGGRCRDHTTPLERVTETNWFFRLSRYERRLIELIESGELLVDPPPFRTEVLSFLRCGLRDISVSRSVERAHGWGLGVPNDPTQVIYVWFDALTNYISSLGFGTADDDYERWWTHSDERIHVVGKGILRFHAVYWPAFLLSAGEPLPTRVHVHPYLTIDGAKIAKSVGGNTAPSELVAQFGTEAIRWWCARDVSPVADTDFTTTRLVASANENLANGIGNAVYRIASLVHQQRAGIVTNTGAELLPEAASLATQVATALADFDRRTATQLITTALGALNRNIAATAPWALAKQANSTTQFDTLIDCYIATLRSIADALRPITPDLATVVDTQLGHGGPLPSPQLVFSRLEV